MKIDAITSQQVVEAERFDLRPLRLSDRGLIRLYAGDKRIAYNTTSIPHPLPAGVTADVIKRGQAKDHEEAVWASDRPMAGVQEWVGLTRRVREPAQHLAFPHDVTRAAAALGRALTNVERGRAGNQVAETVLPPTAN